MSSNNDDDAAPKAEDAAPKHLNLKVKDQQENEINFKLKFTTPMDKLMKAYSQQQDKALDSFRFMFEGVRFNGDDTAVSMEMKDGDCIQVFQFQQGGCELF